MQQLTDEILRRFPEVASRVYPGDEELPYLMVGHVVDWLRSVARPRLEPGVIERVVDFDRWCMAQPPGQTAADDLLTIIVVALHEKLFKYDELLPLVPHVMTREQLVANRDYLVGWVGAERYAAAL